METATRQDAKKFVGQRIRAARFKRNLRQMEVAELAHLQSEFPVSQIENGKYDCQVTIVRVATVLGLDFSQLMAEYANGLVGAAFQAQYEELRKFCEPESQTKSA